MRAPAAAACAFARAFASGTALPRRPRLDTIRWRATLRLGRSGGRLEPHP